MKRNAKIKTVLLVMLTLLLLCALPLSVFASDSESHDVDKAIFFVSMAFIGLILPAALEAVGIILAKKSKIKEKKMWYTLVGIGIVWTLIFIAITLSTVI